MRDVTEALIERLSGDLPFDTVQPHNIPILLDDVRYRSSIGLDRYGTRLKTNNGRDALVDLYEELLDAYFYAMQYTLENEGSEASNLSSLSSLVPQIEDTLDVCIQELRSRAVTGFLARLRPLNSPVEGNG